MSFPRLILLLGILLLASCSGPSAVEVPEKPAPRPNSNSFRAGKIELAPDDSPAKPTKPASAEKKP